MIADGLGNGADYGWDDCEGLQPFEGSCAGSVPPALVYSHAEGCSITGGYVYRGCRMPDLQGRYFYGDYCAGFVRSFRFVGGQVQDEADHTGELAVGAVELTTFGQDNQGEIYIARHGAGEVLQKLRLGVALVRVTERRVERATAVELVIPGDGMIGTHAPFTR